MVIRADASTCMGTGHVMRCIALAQGWRRDGGDLLFALAECTLALEQRLRAENFAFVRLTALPGSPDDAAQTIRLAREYEATWIVADGYHFDTAYQRAIKDAGRRLLLVDDYGHAEHYCADYILNQNLYASAKLYTNREPHTKLLLGTRYVLLRQQFLDYREWQRQTLPDARKILVTLGGGDPDNATGKVIEALCGLDVEAKIVVGGSNPHLEQLRSQVSAFIPHPSSLVLLTDVSNMPELMAWADVAVAAGGTTSWELAFMGLPSLVLVLADNQQPVADALDAGQVARRISTDRIAAELATLLHDGDRRREMSQRARQLVDGEGVNRVATCLRSVGLSLRRVREDDCRLIWEWANEPQARAVSLSSEPIPWETHLKWFAARVNSPACLFYVATNSHDAPVGQIRYDINGDEAVVSVSLAKEARGRGYGAALIVRGDQQCFGDSAVKLIRAHIKPNNEWSVRAFERAGYTDAGMAEVGGHTMRQLVFLRETNA